MDLKKEINEIFKSKSLPALSNLGEIALDQLFDEGSILRQVPFLGTLVASLNTIGAVSNLLFAEKFLIFF